ncbi:MAG: NADH-quinone oxidoreductase subunit NuoG [Gammaproteobacteria bacterium]|nr:NADH-quinone oxidoreductase subunit NuoG [Gammaproteobacteria bacterium]
MNNEIPKVKINIDNQVLEVTQGSMIIEAADDAGIVIPRFCYHKKLSVAANCRMCLVDVENSRRPMPACATPVTEGMVVRTKSEKAISYQKAVMEFLLINHPLDCPICDQGGECELQDLSMGYGKDISKYTEGKRSIPDKDIGPLVKTDLTRCIQCSRCVRFGIEVAGMRELGLLNRGDRMEIGTFLQGNMDSELSGNVIDLCPVGALTSKPFRYKARAWELQASPSVSPHDCVGSNIFIHTRRNEVMRVVPRENEAINEVWISDRDRYSYEGLNHSDRITKPMLKKDGAWIEVEWFDALEYIKEQLEQIKQTHGVDKIAALASSNSSTEEHYLLQKLMRGIGTGNVDHRLYQSDFAHQDQAGAFPGLDCNLADIEGSDCVLMIGGNFRHDQPLLNQRVRKAVLQGAKTIAVNPESYDYNYDVDFDLSGNLDEMLITVAALAKAVSKDKVIDSKLVGLLFQVQVTESIQKAADSLLKAECPVILAGNIAISHPKASILNALIQIIKQAIKAKGGILTPGANSAGAWLAGAVPHRGPASTNASKKGLNASQLLNPATGIKAYILLNNEPELDSVYGQRAIDSLSAADVVISISPFKSCASLHYATVILPIAAFTETSGTFVNVTGEWQSYKGMANTRGEAKPAWKVIRVLGNMFALPGFAYDSSEEVLQELKSYISRMTARSEAWELPAELPKCTEDLVRVGTHSIYASDGLVRRAVSLQATELMKDQAIIRINATLASRLNIKDGDSARVQQNQGQALTLPVRIDNKLANNSVFIPSGLVETALLGEAFGPINIMRA